MTASPIPPKCRGGKQQLPVLMDSVGQEFGQRTAWSAWLCLPTSGASSGGLEDLGLVHSHVCGWCWLWTETFAGASSCHLASSQYGGWVSKVSIPRESHALWTRPWQSHRHFDHIVLTEDVSFRERNRLHLLKEECRHYTEGRTCGDGCVLVHSSLKNTTDHKNFDVEITRKMPSIGLRRLQESWPSTWTRKRVSY